MGAAGGKFWGSPRENPSSRGKKALWGGGARNPNLRKARAKW